MVNAIALNYVQNKAQLETIGHSLDIKAFLEALFHNEVISFLTEVYSAIKKSLLMLVFCTCLVGMLNTCMEKVVSFVNVLVFKQVSD